MATLFKHIPYSQIKRIAPVFGGKNEKITSVQAREKCDIIINGGTYRFEDRVLDSGLKVDGKYYKETENFGIGIQADNRLIWSYGGKWVPTWMGFYSIAVNNDTMYGRHITNAAERTGIGFVGDEIIIAATTTPMSTVQFGAKYFDDAECWINLDGGGSTQWIAPDGKYVSGRDVAWYIGIWLTDDAKDTEDKETTMITNLPINGDFQVTAAFGEVNKSLWSNGHKGIDIVAVNKTIYSPCEGTVRVVAFDASGWGQYISIGDAKGYRHLLCHLVRGSVKVKVGDKVSRTTVVGTMGSTGNSTGVHLHYQINTSAGVAVDPSFWTHVPNKRGSYKATNYPVDASGNLITKTEPPKVEIPTVTPTPTPTTPTHWAQPHYDQLVKAGVFSGDDTSSVWKQFDKKMSEVTIGEFDAALAKLLEVANND